MISKIGFRQSVTECLRYVSIDLIQDVKALARSLNTLGLETIGSNGT